MKRGKERLEQGARGREDSDLLDYRQQKDKAKFDGPDPERKTLNTHI